MIVNKESINNLNPPTWWFINFQWVFFFAFNNIVVIYINQAISHWKALITFLCWCWFIPLLFLHFLHMQKQTNMTQIKRAMIPYIWYVKLGCRVSEKWQEWCLWMDQLEKTYKYHKIKWELIFYFAERNFIYRLRLWMTFHLLCGKYKNLINKNISKAKNNFFESVCVSYLQ